MKFQINKFHLKNKSVFSLVPRPQSKRGRYNDFKIIAFDYELQSSWERPAAFL